MPIFTLFSEREHKQATFSSEVCRHDSRLHSGSRSDEGDYLLRRLCSKKATNGVDKIFAVRAFFPETFGMLMPDYSQTTVKVFTGAARSLLEAHHNVRFMRFASHSGSDNELPTWVPAWTPIHKHRAVEIHDEIGFKFAKTVCWEKK
jgi:hypothetical protein